MAPRRKKELVLESPRQIRALRTPLRQEIVRTLGRTGPVSVRELAELLDRAPASLYYHVHELEDAGILRQTGTRPAGRREEGVYELAAERIVINRTKRSKAFVSALEDVHRSTLRTAEREISPALEVSRRDAPGRDDAVTLLRLSARLSPSDLRKARRMLTDLVAFLGDRDDPKAAATYSVTVAMARLEP